jgi:hypothetical protein
MTEPTQNTSSSWWPSSFWPFSSAASQTPPAQIIPASQTPPAPPTSFTNGAPLVLSKDRPPIRRPIPLQNEGNTCFINAAMQLMFNIPELFDVILSLPQDLYQQVRDFALRYRTSQIAQAINETTTRLLAPLPGSGAVRQELHKISSTISSGWEQGDADEVIKALFAHLIKAKNADDPGFSIKTAQDVHPLYTWLQTTRQFTLPDGSYDQLTPESKGYVGPDGSRIFSQLESIFFQISLHDGEEATPGDYSKLGSPDKPYNSDPSREPSDTVLDEHARNEPDSKPKSTKRSASARIAGDDEKCPSNFETLFSNNLTSPIDLKLTFQNGERLPLSPTFTSTQFHELPSCLLVSFKLFTNGGVKIQHPLDIPMRFTTQPNWTVTKECGEYEIEGFINHGGGVGGGHYCMYLRTWDGIWYCADDTIVREVAEEKAQNALRNCYIFFARFIGQKTEEEALERATQRKKETAIFNLDLALRQSQIYAKYNIPQGKALSLRKEIESIRRFKNLLNQADVTFQKQCFKLLPQDFQIFCQETLQLVKRTSLSDLTDLATALVLNVKNAENLKQNIIDQYLAIKEQYAELLEDEIKRQETTSSYIQRLFFAQAHQDEQPVKQKINRFYADQLEMLRAQEHDFMRISFVIKYFLPPELQNQFPREISGDTLPQFQQKVADLLKTYQQNP